jgi:crotonobetainyl-CoA:carnitine CoA-transferase CaiB-like acyl-CoA transferase
LVHRQEGRRHAGCGLEEPTAADALLAREIIAHPELIADERFSTAPALAANAYEAAKILQVVFAERSLAEWTQVLATFRGQWSPVQDTVDVLADPQVEANGYIQQATTKDGTPFRLVATPVQFDDQPSVPRRAPDFNEHGDEILTDLLGLDWDTVVDLKVKGVVP